MTFRKNANGKYAITNWNKIFSNFYSRKEVKYYVRFEVSTAMTMKNAVFWDVAPCRYCINRRFRGTYRLHLQGRRKIEKKSASEEPA
jgi:hypothetical protein